MICDRIIPIGWHRCPRCGKRYNARPAVSRINGRSICTECMIDEVLEAARPFMGRKAQHDKEWEIFKREVIGMAERRRHGR